MNNYILIPLIAFFLNNFVWTFIFAQKDNPVNKAFLLFASSLAIWLLSVIIIRWDPGSVYVLAVMRFGSLGWLTVTILFLNFIYVFTDKKKDLIYYILLSASVLVVIINLSSDLITNGYRLQNWGPDEMHGILFVPSVVTVISIPGFYSLYLIWASIKTAKKDNLKKALRLLFIGSSVTLLIGLTSNVIIPNILKIDTIVKAGESGTVIQSILIFIAIIKYRLFTISIEDVSEEIFANVQDSVIIMDTNGFIVQMNKSAELLFSKALNDSTYHIHTLLENHNFTTNFQNTEKTLEKDGSIIYLSMSQASVIQQGKEAGKILLLRNETKRKEAEQEIINAKNKAVELSHLKSHFLAIMSHELRTPMIGILGYSEILEEELSEPELKSMAASISASGGRMINTLTSILELARLESDEIELNLKLIKLDGTISELIFPFKREAGNKNLEFEFISPAKDITAYVDQSLFEVSIKNILKNAVTFTSNGKIVVEIGSEPAALGEWAVIKISDTGIGIPKDSLSKIFEPFRQASEGFDRKYEGTGLGLTISKKFLEKMKGQIFVDSEVGKGTKFIVKVPSAKKFVS